MKKQWWLRQCGWTALAALASLTTGCVPGQDTMGEDDLSLDEDEPGVAALALSEGEPNDTLAQGGVKTITFGEDNRGSLSAADTVDYWRLEVKARTYLNIYLGDIPEGSDYDIELLKDGAPIWTGNQANNENEMIVALDVRAGWYALKITAFNNPQAGSLYLLRAAVTAVSRAKEWVNVQMPYCQAVNHAPDAACGGTCERNGAAANAAWDAYRSDCSGYVSWAWNISSADGGLTTATLPTAFSPVAVTDLLPGDILLHPSNAQGAGHTFLFKQWTDKAAKKARILEEETCGTVAKERDVVLSSVSSGTTTNYQGRTYTARRFIMP